MLNTEEKLRTENVRLYNDIVPIQHTNRIMDVALNFRQLSQNQSYALYIYGL